MMSRRRVVDLGVGALTVATFLIMLPAVAVGDLARYAFSRTGQRSGTGSIRCHEYPADLPR